MIKVRENGNSVIARENNSRHFRSQLVKKTTHLVHKCLINVCFGRLNNSASSSSVICGLIDNGIEHWGRSKGLLSLRHEVMHARGMRLFAVASSWSFFHALKTASFLSNQSLWVYQLVKWRRIPVYISSSSQPVITTTIPRHLRGSTLLLY